MNIVRILERLSFDDYRFRQHSRLLVEGNYHTIYGLADYPGLILKTRKVSFLHGGMPTPL